MNQDGRSSTSAVPRHVAIVMDGNGRWALSRGLPRTEGHQEGLKATKRIVREASGLRLALDYGEQEILGGSVKRAVLTADSVLIGEFNRPRRAPLRVRDVWLEVDGLLLNPQRLM